MQISMTMTIGPAIIFALCGQDIFLYVIKIQAAQ